MSFLFALYCDEFKPLKFGPAVDYFKNVVVGTKFGKPYMGFHYQLAVEACVLQLEERGGCLLLVGHLGEFLLLHACGGAGGICICLLAFAFSILGLGGDGLLLLLLEWGSGRLGRRSASEFGR